METINYTIEVPQFTPVYATIDSAGCDIKADLSDIESDSDLKGSGFLFDSENRNVVLFPGGRVLIPTGIKTEIPSGYEVQIRSRSGLALKEGIIVLNAPGTIDADYRNYWGVILFNTSHKSFVINHGDRIAQAVLNKYDKINWNLVSSLDTTERTGGFGSTGK